MADRPNIVWIYCDELRTDALGCYGNSHLDVRTPHLDALAGEGVRFANCFCNSPVCVPSRMTKMTGLYPEDTGVYHNEGAWPNYRVDGSFTMFPEVFAAHGYRTADFGKLHLPRGMNPWQERGSGSFERAGMMKGVDPGELGIIEIPGPGSMIGGHYPGGRPYPPDRLAEEALEWIHGGGGPYLARLSYVQPHTPVFPPPPYDTMHSKADIPDRFSEERTTSRFEGRFAEIQEAHRLTDEQRRLAQVYYYGLVSWIDSQVGRVLSALDESGQRENTVVVFDADHGASLGEGRVFAKHTFAPQVHRIPRIISQPGTVPRGQVRDDICEGLDLARTLFALAGIESPEQFKGRDLMDSTPPEAVFGTIGYGYRSSWAFPYLGHGRYPDDHGWPRRACVRTERYRLDRTVRRDGEIVGPEERDMFFCDWKEDPFETRNRADDPALAGEIERLNALLDAHVERRVEPPENYVVR